MSDGIIIAIIGFFGVVITAGFGYLIAKVNKVDVKIDGRLTELLELTKKSSHAEGMKDEKETIKPK